MAAFGGFRRVEFSTDGTIDPRPVVLPSERLRELHSQAEAAEPEDGQ